MSKIHPAENQESRDQPLTNTKPIISPPTPTPRYSPCHGRPSVLTVWKRSRLSFQGTDGFTVFDHRGRLVFRVDNYTRKSWSASGGGLILMDGSGKALLTLKPQLLSMQLQWTAYRGEDDHCSTSRAFTMRRPSSLLTMIPRNACEAEVFLGGNTTQSGGDRIPDLKAEGSFRRRNCKIITTAGGQLVANISRKRINSTLLLSDDVFSLIVQPGFQPDLVMAFVMVLDRICYKSFTPMLCS